MFRASSGGASCEPTTPFYIVSLAALIVAILLILCLVQVCGFVGESIDDLVIWW